MPNSQSRDYRELYRLLIEELDDFAIFLMDVEGRITTWNAGVERILGYTEAEFIGQPVSMIFTPEDVARGAPTHECKMATRAGRAPDIRWHLRKDGSRFFVDGVMTAIRNESGDVVALSKVMRDITSRKRAEEDREKLVLDLSRSNEDLTEFAHVVSHDLQTPLRMVKSYAELLEKRYMDTLEEAGKEFLGFVLDGAKTMDRLIKGLLAYSQVAGGAKASISGVSLNGMVDKIVEMFRGVIEETKATVTHGPLPTVQGDPLQLLQVFQNLIGNALKYHRRDELPLIHVSAEEGPSEWLFAVRDNGRGIAMKDTQRIFVPLKRLFHEENIPGSGIGLAICKKIVERSGGRIWVESTPGNGSTFYFTLPV